MDFAGDCRPTQYRRRRTRRAAEDDILGRSTFEINRVDDGVTNQGHQGQEGREQVDEQAQHQHGQHAQQYGENQGAVRVEVTAGQRPCAGASHDLVDALVDDVVESRSRGRGQADPQSAENKCVPGWRAGGGKQHADDRREDDQEHYPGFAQLEVLFPAGYIQTAVCGGFPYRIITHLMVLFYATWS